MATKIQLRRDTKINWTNNNPILADGEIGFETDTQPYKFKVGDGRTPWNSLVYEDDGAISETGQSIRDKLALLVGDERLDASHIKNIPNAGTGAETGETIKNKLQGLAGNDRLDITAIKSIAADTDAKVLANTNELNRIKTLISTDSMKIFTYRGSMPPAFTNDIFKGYYLSLFGLRSNININLPSTIPTLADSTVFCLDNNDNNDNIILYARNGETIDGRISITISPNAMIFLVKNGKDWAVAFNGYIPISLSRMIGDIKAALPAGSLSTIDEIQALLKDRLHTFREIQSEFSNQLHTLDEIDKTMVDRGFSKSGAVSYGLADQPAVPRDTSWIVGHMNPNEEILMPSIQGSKYVLIAIPIFLMSNVNGVKINNVEVKMVESEYVQNELKYKILISPNALNASQAIRIEIIYLDKNSNGIMVDDGLTQAAGVNKIVLQNGKIGTYSDDPSKIDVTTSLLFKGETGDVKATSVRPLLPLRAQSNPSVIGETVLDIVPGTYEETQDDSYLAYLQDDTELMPNKKEGQNYTHDTIWFDDVQKDAGNVIGINRNNKSFIIEESDMVDPNLSNGEKYLMCVYLDIKGKAKTDCFIELFFKKAGTTEYITDSNGNPCFISKVFKTGDTFGFLAINTLILAKGQQEIQVCISHNNSENIVIEGLGSGVSGILIQQMKRGTVSAAKAQYEGDTDSSIRVSKLDISVLADLALKLRTDSEEQTFPAKYYQNDSDRFYMIAHSSLKSRREKGQLIIENDGNNKTFFELGWEINDTISRALRGKSIHTDHIITVPLNDLTLGMYEWRGTGNPTAPVLQWNKTTNVITTSPGWNEVLVSDITHSIDKQEDTTTFNVPYNSNKFMLIMYPTKPSEPFEMRLQKFSVIVDVPFTDYIVRGAESTKTEHFEYDKSYAKFKMLFDPHYQLRYTINKADTKMPVGYKTIGAAPIENKIAWSDSGYKGEGALEFAEDGKANITTTLQLNIGENVPNGGSTQIEFWYAKANKDGTFFKIIESSTIFTLDKVGNYPKFYAMKNFVYDAKAGDVVWLFARSTTVDDGAYLIIPQGSRSAMVDTDIYFESMTTFQNDPSVNEIKFLENGKEVFNKQLQYDVNTGKMSVIDIGGGN